MSESSSTNPLREAIRLGLGGAKANIRPGSILWLIGVALVISYYRSPSVSEFLDRIGEFKVAHSPWFSIISTALFGSLIPWLAQAVFLPAERRQPFRQVPLLLIFWGFHGWQVDLLYQGQAAVFGNGLDAKTIICKVLVDELLWVPFLAIPQIVIGYLFIENNLSTAKVRSTLAQKSYLSRMIPLMIANWIVWVPSVTMIYLFPLPLQLPLMNIILTLWCLIVIFFTKNS